MRINGPTKPARAPAHVADEAPTNTAQNRSSKVFEYEKSVEEAGNPGYGSEEPGPFLPVLLRVTVLKTHAATRCSNGQALSFGAGSRELSSRAGLGVKRLASQLVCPANAGSKAEEHLSVVVRIGRVWTLRLVPSSFNDQDAGSVGAPRPPGDPNWHAGPATPGIYRGLASAVVPEDLTGIRSQDLVDDLLPTHRCGCYGLPTNAGSVTGRRNNEPTQPGDDHRPVGPGRRPWFGVPLGGRCGTIRWMPCCERAPRASTWLGSAH